MQRLAAHLAVVVLVAGCGGRSADADESAVDDWLPGGKTDVYGSDDRREVYEADPVFRQVAQSTLLVVSSTKLYLEGGERLRLVDTTYTDKIRTALGAPLCDSEPFRTQPAPGYCSGFLAAPDLVVTAGHCVNTSVSCAELRFVFDFAYDEHVGEPEVTLVSSADFYRCQTVVGHLYDRDVAPVSDPLSQELWSDWAVVKLDRPVTGRAPLPLRDSGAISQGRRAVAVGHPGGVPTKVTDGRVVDDSHELYFNTDLDIFAGNSGSAVVSGQGVVEGISIRGSGGDSFELAGGCYRSRVCDAYDPTTVGCTGNHVMRVAALSPFLAAGGMVVESTELVGDAGILPDGQGEVMAELQVGESGVIRYVTVNVDMSSTFPEDLQITVERDGGQQVPLFDRPKLKQAGWSVYSRSTKAFDGQQATGTWLVRVRDSVQNVASYQRVSSVELVVGLD
ncbi:MAG: trypsin-like peptidase domain-containing protein [Deltaproteobacteria bacterium]|jgi:V8-like Glu-specific endopeptidase|nr:trypsin-like peptidase domain-containing protein [Deltaproteobacteria bacterium]MBW2532987.1 trypsin-like peptidase domain-containing protein [Deltaproteobacteria bacterium]